MAIYTVQDSETGKTIKFEWNDKSPPTDKDMEEVFASAKETKVPTPTIPQQQGSYLGQAVSNIPGSLYNLGKNIVSPILSPKQTLQDVLKLYAGSMNKLMVNMPPQPSIDIYPEAVGQYFGQRYGGTENIAETFKTDPAGAMADLATVLMGVGGIGSKIPQISRYAQPVLKAGQLVDPITGTGKIISGVVKAGEKAAAGPLGFTTGLGKPAMEKAIESNPTFRAALRGAITAEDTVEAGRSGLHALKADRATTYKGQLQQIQNMPNAPSMDIMEPMREFSKALKDFEVELIKSPNGKIIGLDFADSTLRNNPKAQGDFNKMLDTFRNAFDKPQVYSTPEGFDILKRQIFDIYSESSQGRAAVERVGKTTRDQLINRVPGYETMVKDYEKTSRVIDEIERDFSLGNKKSVDTAMRKLNSAMREDEGFRRSLMEKVSQASGKDIAAMVSGRLSQSMIPKSWWGKDIAIATTITTIFAKPELLPLVTSTSPRIMAETFNLLSKGEKIGKAITSPKFAPERMGLFQTGRPTDIYSQMAQELMGGK